MSTVNQTVIDQNLLSILACPESHQPLRLLEPLEILKINALITKGGLKTLSGEACLTEWLAGLIREDGRRAYQIQDGLPILLIESSVEL